MTRPGDPKGYYARLGVAAWATAQAIDTAFRARSGELRPDRNPAPGAAERYQAILEAHQVLSDERARRAYDATAKTLGTAEDRAELPPTALGAVASWFQEKPVLVGVIASAVLVIAIVAAVRAPPDMTTTPARALTPPALPIAPRLERRIVSASGVNLRRGPGIEHAPASRIARGETVELLEPESDGWVRIRLGDGRTGYIASRFLTAP